MLSFNCDNIQDIVLRNDSWLKFSTNFLDEENAKKLYDHLMDGYLYFEHSERTTKDGSTYRLPRLQSWMADNEFVNAQLYQKQAAKPWSEMMAVVKAELERVLECQFDYVLINMYRDGEDFIGMHADDEAYLPGKTTIASISLGSTRTFKVVHHKKKEETEHKLNNGSLIVMGGQCQKHYRHGIPKEPEVKTPRINLTFRKS